MKPSNFYTNEQCKLQADNDSTKLANAVVNAIVSEELQAEQIDFISTRDFFFSLVLALKANLLFRIKVVLLALCILLAQQN